MTPPTYSVAIRTLGKAGHDFQRELDSLLRQTIPPRQILVYLAEGYPRPAETIGIERYVTCPKGMIAQRALPFDEIDSEWILFLDDDVELAPDTVERLFSGVREYDSSCITADTFAPQREPLLRKLRFALALTWPHWRPDWAFRIRRCGHFSYNNHPARDVLATQSGAGNCILIRKEAYRNIHFEDERWMDFLPYALGDDMLFHYKIFRYGYKPLIHYNCGAVHLDAGSSRTADPVLFDLNKHAARYILWYRTQWESARGVWAQMAALAAYSCTELITQCAVCLRAAAERHWFYIPNVARGIAKGYRFVRSDAYRRYPRFMQHAQASPRS